MYLWMLHDDVFATDKLAALGFFESASLPKPDLKPRDQKTIVLIIRSEASIARSQTCARRVWSTDEQQSCRSWCSSTFFKTTADVTAAHLVMASKTRARQEEYLV